MSYLRTHSIFLGFSALAALALAIGCSQSADDGDSASAGDSVASDGGADSAAADAGPREPQTLVISQVYGGGGNSKATFQNDFVELFNRGDDPIGLKGYSIQYIGFDKNFANNVSVLNLPDAQLDPGHYFLVQLAGPAGDAGAPQGAPVPNPDYTATTALELINLSQSDGKIALVHSDKLLNGCGAAGSPCPDFVDLVGFGKATQFEGAPVPTLLTTGQPANAAIRKLGGCMAFYDNAYDFEVNVAAPRNAGTTASPKCSTVDAGAPPPPPPPPADGGTTTTTDGGKTTTTDGGKTSKSDGGKGTTKGGSNGGLETPDAPTDDGSNDPDGTHPESAADGATPPPFPATSPSCSTTMTTNGSSALGGLFGLALVAGALRRRKK